MEGHGFVLAGWWVSAGTRSGWYIFGMGVAAVCYQEDVAAILNRAGVHVVLCGPEAATLGEAVGRRRAAEPEGDTGWGRLAVFVGQPEVAEAEARAMALELFGAEPMVVPSVAEAEAVASDPPTGQDR